ncbi:YraN family protein [Testudinibacter sp. P80/BLE/0925]|uniref:YraN family protein n=1 Tax=Testudinibacter sp. TW-1 TaxID=3417757 RepID=UPI003D35A5FB
MFNKRKQGAQYEQQARLFLERQGLQFIAANQTFPGGELDLIMSDGKTTVFVEVRQRSDDRFGAAWESVSTQKQQRWVRAAEQWLLQRRQNPETSDFRFDLITFEPQHSGAEPLWFKHFIEFNY